MIPLLFWVKLLSGPSAINGALPIPVDCEWSGFTDWTSCSKTCGQGSQVRTRDIFREPVNGGKPCEGPKIQKRNCIDGEQMGFSRKSPSSSEATFIHAR